jgi:hypothetical protein
MAAALLVGCAKTPTPSSTVTPPTTVKVPTPEELATKILDGMDHLASEVAALKTAEAATEAAPRLEQEVDELKRQAEQFRTMNPLSPDQQARRKAEFAPRVKQTKDAFDRQRRRMSNHSQIGRPLYNLWVRMGQVQLALTFTFIGDGVPNLAEATTTPANLQPATIVVQGTPPNDTFGPVADAVRELIDYGPISNSTAWSDHAHFVLPNIADLKKLADGITFGKVTSVDDATRTIVVELDPTKIP